MGMVFLGLGYVWLVWDSWCMCEGYGIFGVCVRGMGFLVYVWWVWDYWCMCNGYGILGVWDYWCMDDGYGISGVFMVCMVFLVYVWWWCILLTCRVWIMYNMSLLYTNNDWQIHLWLSALINHIPRDSMSLSRQTCIFSLCGRIKLSFCTQGRERVSFIEFF